MHCHQFTPSVCRIFFKSSVFNSSFQPSRTLLNLLSIYIYVCGSHWMCIRRIIPFASVSVSHFLFLFFIAFSRINRIAYCIYRHCEVLKCSLSGLVNSIGRSPKLMSIYMHSTWMMNFRGCPCGCCHYLIRFS